LLPPPSPPLQVWPTLLSPWLLVFFIAMLVSSYFGFDIVHRFYILMLFGWLAVLALVSLAIRWVAGPAGRWLRPC
jgi:hypothetical protein